MGNKKKALKAQSSNKLGQQSSRMDNSGQLSSMQKQRKSTKKRKSIKLTSADSEEIKEQHLSNATASSGINTQLQQQIIQSSMQQSSKIQLIASSKDTRAQTLSPEKNSSLYKLDQLGFNNQQNKNLFEVLHSPKQPQTGSLRTAHAKITVLPTNQQDLSESKNLAGSLFVNNALDNSLKHRREPSSQLSINSTYNSKGRPYTTSNNTALINGPPTAINGQQMQIKSSKNEKSEGSSGSQVIVNGNTNGMINNTGSGTAGSRSLVPLAVNAAKKLQQQQNIQMSIQGQSSSIQSEQRQKQSQPQIQSNPGFSPAKINSAIINNNNQSSYQLQTQHSQQYQEPLHMSQDYQQHQQQQSPQQINSSIPIKHPQFQHILNQKQENVNNTSNQGFQQNQIIQQQILLQQQQQLQQYQLIQQQLLQQQQQDQHHSMIQKQHAQVGINGLLNMTKQRGLNHQQIYNVRNHQGTAGARSQSSQKNHQQQQHSQQQQNYLQNNGKNIMAQKSPLYSSLNGNGAQKIVQGQFIPPNHQQNQSNLSYQQTCPLSIFDIQFYQSKQYFPFIIQSPSLGDLMIQPNKIYPNKQAIQTAINNNNNNQFYPTAQQYLNQQQQLHQNQQHTGFALIPARQQQQQQKYVGNGLIVSQPQYLLQKQSKQYGLQNNGYYYYDLPVQINGKQMGVPANYAKQQDRTNFRKGGSQATLAQQNSLHHHHQQYQLDPQAANNYMIHYDQQALAHEEMLKQAILQELLENQALPAQLLSSHSNLLQDKNFFTSMIGLSQSEKLQAELAASQNSQLSTTVTTNNGSKIPPQTVVKKVSKIPFANAYVEDCYKFIVVAGNNSGLIRKAIERRDWWIEIPAVHSMYNFKWQPVSNGIKFERLSPIKPKPGEIGGNNNQYSSFQNGVGEGNSGNGCGDSMVMKQVVNHFEFHHFISEKANLFNMLQKYCDNSKESIFDLCPITFYVEVQDLDKQQQYNQSLQAFVQFYQTLEENKERIRFMEEQIKEYQEKLLTNPQKEDDDSDQHQSKEDPLQSGTTATGGNTNKEKDWLSIINNKNPTSLNQFGATINTNNATQKVTKFKTFNFEKRTAVKYNFPMCHFDGYNLWLLKPTHLNRGRGIHVFRDLETLHKLIKEYTQGKDEEVKMPTKKESAGSPSKTGNLDESGNLQEQDACATLTELDQERIFQEQQQQQQQQQQPKKRSSPKKSNAYKIKHNTFIIQKYIEKPLLIFNRKFDIRVWVLLDQDYDMYFFKEGYLRTSSSEFSIDLENIDNQYVHLTNNAVQKFSEHYGQFEDGNQLSFKRLQEVLDLQYPNSGVDVYDDLVPQMKELIVKSMYAVRKKIDPFRRKHCFELFGYDFILDEDFNVWLIEVNTNPCIEESSELLKILLPRMIEDMMKLTIDRTFPKIKKTKGKKSSSTVTSSPIKNLSTKLPKPQQQPSQLDKIEEEATELYQSVLNTVNTVAQNANKESFIEEKAGLEEESKEKKSRIHPVNGYSNSENMWEKLWNLEKAENPPNKYPNHGSEFFIHVNENKQFKLKRNPLYKKIVKEMQNREDKINETTNGKVVVDEQ